MTRHNGGAAHLRQQADLYQFLLPISFHRGWTLQQRLHQDRVEGRRRDALLLLQHEPVYTIGRRTSPAHLPGGEIELLRKGATVEYVSRGGSITFHGPGQLVGYPIFLLSDYAPGPRKYVWLLEETVIRTLSLWDIPAYRIHRQPGVFVRGSEGDAKIASIGIRVERGVTLHGFSLNLDLDLGWFSCIIPCGLSGCGTASIASLSAMPVSFSNVAHQVSGIFGQLFGLSWTVQVETNDIATGPGPCPAPVFTEDL
ncbi:Octanoyltransferase [Nitrospira sp. KM1]|uniref:lipoyl(octanoyl) transferase LipB n=1 Tax=Nitrospira sp. KM1 TaxID=1936990 RepID=UPI0013A788AF|nr:lipoyl(octanoyl) transferase LipB [Nitrospira sp. KM1]BCA55579.1 Octanoyltransferase [Nitrospira sp. KM1]